MTILVIGEALIDVSEDRRITPPAVTEHVGGSPANVAIGLARLGERVKLVTSLARDERGERIAAAMAEAGVCVDASSWNAERTSAAHALIDPAQADDGSATYSFDFTWDVAVPEVTDANLLHAGSLASYVAPGADVVTDAMQCARQAGILVTYDPNVRRDLITDPEATREQILRACARADVVKLSDEDCLWLFPGGVEESLRTLLEYGCCLVIVTAGAGGSIIATPAGWITVPSERVTVADTIGAGDSFMATLIAELRHRVVTPGRDLASVGFAELSAIGARCARAAAITVSRPGANPPTLAEVLSAEIHA